MKYLVDTNVCSDFLRRRGEAGQRFLDHAGELAVSVITVGELRTWAYRRRAKGSLQAGIDSLLTQVAVLPIDMDVADRFGQLRASLFDAGRPTPELDLLIAATAIVHDLTLVTHNTRDFADIPGVRLDDWQA